MAVQYERQESIALITLDRPGSLNAINVALSRELREAWERFMAEDDALVAVLTGAGRAFCAGHDMKEAAEGVRTGQEMKLTPWLRTEEITKPAIAAVNGPCAGGGIAIMLACDIAICAEGAQFVLPFAARGRGGASVVLDMARRTSINAALYAGLTAARISSEMALRMGLVQEVLPQEDLLPRALELAEKIAGHSQVSIRNIKGHLLNALQVGAEQAYKEAGRMDAEVAQSQDMREGTIAFDEKRRPQYENR
ncbi:MAG: enoyl-CoA hydratase/isomerase family protein [Dehalococcoidia bacterium]